MPAPRNGSAVPPLGDVVGFYAALGVTIRARPGQANASVHCFINPDRHHHADRDRSMSVLMTTGAFRCHGCDARGGAYDAAIALGRTPREAVELMIAHGLRQPRDRNGRQHTDGRSRRAQPPPQLRPVPRRLETDEHDVACWARALQADRQRLDRLWERRGWTPKVITRYQIGIDPEGRITIPVRDHDGTLAGVQRYQPFTRRGRPKALWVPGSRPLPFPAPEHVMGGRGPILVCEGAPDALCALSHGLPATSVPGAAAWQRQWARRLTGRLVVICMDADAAGREAGHRSAGDLAGLALDTRLLDPAPGRNDHTDLTDMLRDGRVGEVLRALIASAEEHRDRRRFIPVGGRPATASIEVTGLDR